MFRMLRTKAHMFQDHMCLCRTFSTMNTEAAVIGIDFGGKNSRVAVIDSLVPQVVGSEIGRFTPSYVTLTPMNVSVPFAWALQHLDSGGRVSVGEVAKRKMPIQPSDVVFNAKKMVGKKFHDADIQAMRKRVHFCITEGSEGEPWVEIQGMELSPVEITSFIFTKLKDVVLLNQFHQELKVVISVPFFFTEQQNEDIRSAGKRAGLDVLDLIDETRAAALSSTSIKEGLIVVFGMGSGSYSVAVLCVSGAKFEMKAQLGNSSMGGDQFDDILVDYFVREVSRLYSIDIAEDKRAMTMLSEAAEQAKVELSSQPEATVSIPYLTSSAQLVPVHLNITISRQQFEVLVNNLVEQIQHKCHAILEEAKITDSDIGEIVFAGGMTRVPKIRETIYQVFGRHQTATVDPEEAVVIGCAIQAALIVEEKQEMSKDMIPLSIGIECDEGIFARVIPRHTTLPAKQTVKIPAWCAPGECLRVRIFVGEHVLIEHNTPLGEVELISNRNLCRGCADFELTIEVDKGYLVKVSAGNADNQLAAADALGKSMKVVQVYEKVIDEELVNKHSVNDAVRTALLDWRLHTEETNTMLRNAARYAMNTLSDVLSARKGSVPENFCKEAVKVLSDLEAACGGDFAVLKDKIITAKSVELTLLQWGSDSEESARGTEEARGMNFGDLP